MTGRPTKPRLTRKQLGFVKDYVETGNGTKAALRNYDVVDDNTAASIASENLRKPQIVQAVQDALPEDLLAKKHLELLNASHAERINFDYRTPDEDILEVVSRMPGYELLHIVRNKSYSEVYAYVKAPDSATQDKALDKAYKLKGSYAPERSLGVVATVELNHVHQERARKLIAGYLRAS